MNECSKKHLALVWLLIVWPAIGSASMNETSWQAKFQQQVMLHPVIVAEKEKMNAAASVFSGSNMPIYNPEIVTDFENEGGENNYRVGISQTFDWQDKVSVRKKNAAFTLQTAKASFQLVVENQTAESLGALVSWQAARQQMVLAREQEGQLNKMLVWVDERQKSGDLGQIDAELAVFGLTQRLNETASAEANLKKLQSIVDEALPELSNADKTIPEVFWSRVMEMSTRINRTSEQQWLEEHPVLMIAKSEWQQSKLTAMQVKKDANADPTVGISVGRDSDNDVFGLSLLIPLNVRNNYSAESKAALQRMLSKESKYYAVRRHQKQLIESSLLVLKAYQPRANRWRKLMNGRGERGAMLINQQWRSGDLSTAEYLLVMQQMSESLSSGIELRKQFKLARIDWLLQTGQLSTALAQ